MSHLGVQRNNLAPYPSPQSRHKQLGARHNPWKDTRVPRDNVSVAKPTHEGRAGPSMASVLHKPNFALGSGYFRKADPTAAGTRQRQPDDDDDADEGDPRVQGGGDNHHGSTQPKATSSTNSSLAAKMDMLASRSLQFVKCPRPDQVDRPRRCITLNPQHIHTMLQEQHQQRASGRATHDDHKSSSPHAAPTTSAPYVCTPATSYYMWDAPLPALDNNETTGGRGAAVQGSGDIDDDDPKYFAPPVIICNPRLQKAVMQWPRVVPPGGGLDNVCNNCFANCILQAMAYTPPLYHYLEAFANKYVRGHAQQHAHQSAGLIGGKLDVMRVVAELVVQLRATPQKKSVRPQKLLDVLGAISPQFRKLGVQHDCQEFLCQIFDRCNEMLIYRYALATNSSGKLSVASEATTPLAGIVGGFTRSRVAWSGKEELEYLRKEKSPKAEELAVLGSSSSNKAASTLHSDMHEPFSVLHVPIAGSSIDDCLRAFCAPEVLDGRSYQTPRDAKVNASKHLTVHVPPRVLILHLKRFDNNGSKVFKHVRFGTKLNFAPYCTVAKDAPAYRLTAVAVHHGRSLRYGHYTTYFRSSNDLWYDADDETVRQTSEDTVLRSDAYMLFYVAVVNEMCSPRLKPQAPATARLQQQQHHPHHHHHHQHHDAEAQIPPFTLAEADEGVEVKVEQVATLAKRPTQKHQRCQEEDKTRPTPISAHPDDDVWEDDGGAGVKVEETGSTTWDEDLKEDSEVDVPQPKKRRLTEQMQRTAAPDTNGSRHHNQQQAASIRPHSFTTLRNEDIPETLRRRAHQGKFHHSSRDAAWENEMDKGRVKKVKKNKTEIWQHQRNVFQHAANTRVQP